MKKHIRYHIYFSETPSRFETTKERVEEIAKILGVSKNKAIAYAVNELYERLIEEKIEEEFAKRGKRVANALYLNVPEEELAELSENVSRKVPLPLIRDSELEHNFLFAGLPEEKKEAIRNAATPEEKRALLAQAVEEFIKSD